MYTLYFVNHGYAHERQYATVEEAILAARSFCFDAAIMKDKQVVASWSVFGGERRHCTTVVQS